MFSRGGTVGGFRAPEFSVPKFQDEARSLARERNPELFWEGVLQLGRRLEAAQDHEAAAQLYQQVVQSEKDHGASPSLRHRAQVQLSALDGSGPSPFRAEFLLRHLARETCEPSTLIGMTAASTAFRLTRLASLSRLAGSPAANLATRGFGARMLSGLLGFGVEATVFPLATRGASALFGKNLSWDSVSVTRELVSSFLVLGGMKLVGLVAGFGGPPLPVPLPRGERGLTAGLLRQGGMLGGIVLGHKLEEAAGLRAPRDGVTTWADSLAMLVQVNAAGRLSQGLLGPGFRAWERTMDFQIQNLGNPSSPRPATWLASPAFAGPGRVAPARGVEPKNPVAEFSRPMKMSMLGGPPEGGLDFLERRLGQVLAKKWELAEDHPDIVRLMKQVKKTRFHFREDESRDKYYDLLRRSHLRALTLGDIAERSASHLMTHATEVFRYTMELNPLRRATGSFYDYMVQVAFERVLQEGKVHAFDQLVRIVAVHQTTAHIEHFLREQGLSFPYEFRNGLWKISLFKRPKWITALDALKLPRAWRNLIGNYLATYTYGEFSGAFRDLNYNYLILHPRGQEPRREPMDARYAVDSLTTLFAKSRNDEALMKLLDACWTRAAESKVPLLYLDRMFKIIATGDMEEKLVEMADTRGWDTRELRNKLISEAVDPELWGPAVRLNGTIYTAYLNDLETSRKFARFYRWLPHLVNPEGMEHRREGYRSFAEQQLMGKKNFGREEILELLYHRPTAVAKLARQAILDKKVDFEVLSKEAMTELWLEKGGSKKFPEVPSGIFLPPDKSNTGKPYIAIQELDPELSRKDKIARAVYLAAFTVHEFEHALHYLQLDFKFRRSLLLGEMRAWLEENFYLLLQGEDSEWEEATRVSPQGFAMYLRNLVDRDYIQGPRDLVMARSAEDESDPGSSGL